MAKKKKPKRRKARMGKKRVLGKAAAVHVVRGLAAVRAAKVSVEKTSPGMRKAWAELHHVESRLSRLA